MMASPTMIVCLAAMFHAAITCAQPTPQRPEFPGTFMSKNKATISYVDADGSNVIYHGNGYRYYDTTANKAVTNITFVVDAKSNVFERHFNLRRFDQGMQYNFLWDSNTTLKCTGDKVKDSPKVTFWDWLPTATYAGKRTYNQQELEFWTGAEASNGVINEVGVSPSARNRPVVVFNIHKGSKRKSELQFTEFEARAAKPESFDVPKFCQSLSRPEQHTHRL